MNAVFQSIPRREKKAFLSDQWKEIEENNRVGKTRDLFKKIRDTKVPGSSPGGSRELEAGMALARKTYLFINIRLY